MIDDYDDPSMWDDEAATAGTPPETPAPAGLPTPYTTLAELADGYEIDERTGAFLVKDFPRLLVTARLAVEAQQDREDATGLAEWVLGWEDEWEYSTVDDKDVAIATARRIRARAERPTGGTE